MRQRLYSWAAIDICPVVGRRSSAQCNRIRLISFNGPVPLYRSRFNPDCFTGVPNRCLMTVVGVRQKSGKELILTSQPIANSLLRNQILGTAGVLFQLLPKVGHEDANVVGLVG